MTDSIKKTARGSLGEAGCLWRGWGVKGMGGKKGENEDAVLLAVAGRIDLSNAHFFGEKLRAYYEEGIKDITLDFSRVTGIDSSGLGKLLLFQKRLKERGGKLRIINVTSSYIRKMFKMIHLYKVIDIENIEAEIFEENI